MTLFIIAEAGSNWRHGGDGLKNALTLIDVAADAGADAVKFQLFRAGTTWAAGAGPCDHLAKKGLPQSIEEIFRDLELPLDFLPKLHAHCDTRGIELMISAFSEADFATIDPFVSRHKIASFELHHPGLLRLAAASGKPTLLSTGLCNLEEVEWAVAHHGGRDLTLLQCTIQYPTDPTAMHLLTLPTLRDHFGLPVGLSDHSRHPTVGPVSAVALGATVIEKHFTLSNDLPGPDHSWALTPPELTEMVEAVRLAQQMRGGAHKQIATTEEELVSYAPRRVQTIKEIAIGESFLLGENIAVLRPGEREAGVHPRHLVEIEGKRARRALTLGAGLQQGDW